MKTIYVDNFRGFSETYINLKEVNFFVGENSTGKTSILKLINIISSNEFWRYGEFGSSEIPFQFIDIVNSLSKKSFFEIGLFDDENTVTAYKFKFVDNNNQVQIREIYYYCDGTNIQITIEGLFLKYRHYAAKMSSIDDFKNWTTTNQFKDIPFNKIETDNLGVESILSKVLIEMKKKDNIDKFLYNSLVWFAPTRYEPERYYSEGDQRFDSRGRNFPNRLKSLFTHNLQNTKKILNKFGQDSGLYEDIDINEYKNNKGRDHVFEISVSLNGNQRNIVNVGYGLPQILPIIVEVLGNSDGSWFAIQQPETHLHPRAQAAIGDFILKSNEINEHKFFIETHSDYLIDRYRLKMNRSNKDVPPSQVLFFTKNKKGNSVHHIKLNKNGSYSDNQPVGFRDFFLNEQFELITM